MYIYIFYFFSHNCAFQSLNYKGSFTPIPPWYPTMDSFIAHGLGFDKNPRHDERGGGSIIGGYKSIKVPRKKQTKKRPPLTLNSNPLPREPNWNCTPQQQEQVRHHQAPPVPRIQKASVVSVQGAGDGRTPGTA